MSKPDYERIYLVPEDGIWCWAGTPAPGAGQSNADAVEYVRADLYHALAAQVEALRKALLPFASTGLPTLVNGENYSVMHDRVKDWFGVSEFVRAIECFNKTPQQHLAEVKAQAGRAGFVAGYMLCNDGSPLIKHNYEGFADQYADSIRQGEVK